MFPIIIQARLGSSRLPSKVIAPIAKWSAIEIIFKRLMHVFSSQQIFFAIPDDIENNLLADKIAALGAQCIRGPEANVYQRFQQVLADIRCDFFIRLTADCPFICVDLLQAGIAKMQALEVDVVHTSPKVAEGLDFEIVNRLAFQKLSQVALSPLQQEHPTLYFYQNPSLYTIVDFDDNHSDNSMYRITLDEAEDLVLIQHIAGFFNDKILHCSWPEIKVFLDSNPHLLTINQNIIRNQGLILDDQ